jgi:hypothetical protein
LRLLPKYYKPEDSESGSLLPRRRLENVFLLGVEDKEGTFEGPELVVAKNSPTMANGSTSLDRPRDLDYVLIKERGVDTTAAEKQTHANSRDLKNVTMNTTTTEDLELTSATMTPRDQKSNPAKDATLDHLDLTKVPGPSL